MAYTFTTSEIAQIEAARDLCPAGDAVPTSTGNWVPFYQKLSDLIGARIDSGTVSGTDLQDLKNAKRWLDVAIGANGGTGMHSAFIRAYTDRQGELRIGSAFYEGEMQKASNGVALNLYKTLSGLKSIPGYLPWQVPKINQIAEFDAQSIGENLFSSLLPAGDTAITNNAAWSGALGFNLLGGASPFESWRLIQAGDTGSAVPNTLDDFKNLLFAVDAYDKALTAGRVQFGFDVAGALGELALRSYEIGEAESLATLQAQLAIGQSSGNWLGAINEIASRTPAIAPVVKLITNVGVNQFLDMLIGARLGKAVYGSTTDANFLANVNAYLGALTPAQLQSYGAELMPTTAAAMVAKAKADINARAALAALSSVSVEIVATAAQDLDLYDPATGTGELTDLYLKDRAAMLSWKMKYDSGALDENDNPIDYAVLGKAYSSKWDTWKIAGDWNFVDLGGSQVNGVPLSFFIDGKGDSIFTADPDHQILFGSGAGESLVGQETTDHLYGMGGGDTLTGNQGNDHLEGGAGFDTYVVNAGDGFDTVLDSDGLGVIKFGTVEAKGSAGLDPTKWIHTAGSNVWSDQTNSITYSKSVVSGETRLIVKKGDATVLIKGWSDGELGIVLGTGGAPVAAPPPVTPATNLTLIGDLAPIDFDAQAAGVQVHNTTASAILSSAAPPKPIATTPATTALATTSSRAGAATTSCMPFAVATTSSKAASSDDGPGELLFPAPNASLENLVNALADLFGTGVKIGDAKTDQREALYLAISAIRNSVPYDQSLGALTIEPLSTLGREQIVARAKLDTAEGQAYRYALYKLNPFAVTGSSVLYDGINAHGELDLYDPASGTGALTERYLRDRAAMLTRQNQFNTDDVEPVGDTFVKLQSGTPFYFEDFTSNAITTKMRIGGGDSVNAVMSRPLGDFRFIVFGSENNDVLAVNGKGMWSYGGAGHALSLRSKAWKEAA